MKLNRKAQSLIEYALLATLVLAAFVTIQTYIKRSLVGKFKDTGDQLGEQFSANQNYIINTTQVAKSNERVGTADLTGRNAFSTSETQSGGLNIIGGMVGAPSGYQGHQVTVKNTTGFDSGNLSEQRVFE